MNLDQKETERPRSSMRRSRNLVKLAEIWNFAIVTYLFRAIFIGMIGYFVCFQLVKSESVINQLSYNSRLDLYAEHVVRGDITAADGTWYLRKTTGQADDGSETRRISIRQGCCAHVVGYAN
ncbi:MAG: hypothetical protein ACLUD0_10660 [Eubacterium ramulus]